MLLPLPMTINKFLEPKTIEMSTFKFKWKADSGAIMKSEIFDLNPKICKSVYDFKKLSHYQKLKKLQFFFPL